MGSGQTSGSVRNDNRRMFIIGFTSLYYIILNLYNYIYIIYIYTPSGLHPYKWRFLAGKFIEPNGGFSNARFDDIGWYV